MRTDKGLWYPRSKDSRPNSPLSQQEKCFQVLDIGTCDSILCKDCLYSADNIISYIIERRNHEYQYEGKSNGY